MHIKVYTMQVYDALPFFCKSNCFGPEDYHQFTFIESKDLVEVLNMAALPNNDYRSFVLVD